MSLFRLISLITICALIFLGVSPLWAYEESEDDVYIKSRSVTATSAPRPTIPARTPQAIVTSSRVIPSPVLNLSTRAKEIYRAGLAKGNNPKSFSKIGDCMSEPPVFLAPFDDPRQYQLGTSYAYLQETIDCFKGSYSRYNITARQGLNVASLFSPLWANFSVCKRGETPLECELRVHQPSLVLISLGTNGSWFSAADYESQMRKVLAEVIQHGAVPILSTKADNVEGDNRFNVVMIKLAEEYQLPLWDFASASSTLPNSGIVEDYHLTLGSGAANFAEGVHSGWQMRNLTALQVLDVVWRGVR